MSSRSVPFCVFSFCVALSVTSSLLVSACAARPAPTPPDVGKLAAGSCGLGLPNNAGNEEAIWALISAESKYVVSQDIDRLMRLWSEDARVTDARHTPDDPSDDQTVQGQDAIRYRYTHVVFPSAPASAQAEDLDIDLLGNQAEVTSTTHIGDQVSPRGDHWRVSKVNGCWVLEELVYNLALVSGK